MSTAATSPVPNPLARLAKPSLDWLLVFVPIAFYLRFASDNPTWLFVSACAAIIPLAGWMGHATEHLADKVGQGLGGLLNATFGNAAELIIALIALSKGPAFYPIVKASITGSIIGNILLVMGLSCLAGGLKFSEQKFNVTAIRSSSSTLMMAAIALLIPAVFHQVTGPTGQWTPQMEQRLSLAIASVLFLTYIATLVFSLKTHKEHFSGEASEAPAEPTPGACLEEDEKAHGGHGHWSVGKSVGVLVLSTIFIALMSEFLVGSVEKARESMGLTEVFVGVIVVAIIGNAAEHSTAILVAMRNKMDLSLGIAIGSSVQIALFVTPVLIFASYLFGQPMDLEFTVPEIAAVLVAIGIVGQISGDGKSNWLEGIQLLAVYVILGILFYYLPDMHAAAAGTAAHGAVAPGAPLPGAAPAH